MFDDFDRQRRMSSMPALIAWVSLCLLSAAWGPMMPSWIRSAWQALGLFGLVAGLGLGALERTRWLLRQRSEWRIMQEESERKMSRFLPHISADSKTNAAIKQKNVT